MLIIKFLALIVGFATIAYTLDLTYKTVFIGNYMANGSVLNNLLVILIPVLVVGGIIYGLYKLFTEIK